MSEEPFLIMDLGKIPGMFPGLGIWHLIKEKKIIIIEQKKNKEP